LSVESSASGSLSPSNGLNVERSGPPRAVFLSYAREDTDAARRIAEALRSQGVEVWFDRAELRGGEAWDAKIKQQIRECALFMAVVSAHTQERTEGYFRREWKLAVERTADMAAGTVFLVPVVIDDTPEVRAVAPEEFMRVQWTRLAGALPTPDFVAQVKSLLGDGRRRPSLAPMDANLTAAPMGTQPPMTSLSRLAPKLPHSAEAPSPHKSSSKTGLWIALVVALLAGGVGAYFFRSSPEPTPSKPIAAKKSGPVPVTPAAVIDKSIAVLPFDNLSTDKENGYFADGVHEDVLTILQNVRELRVISRTSVLQYRATTKTIPQIAQELGVTYVLEGSVRRAGNKVRVTGQLIKAGKEEHVWAKSYDRDLTDIFTIQSELATEIAGALQAVLSPAEKKLLERPLTTNAAAYDLYLKAINAPGDALMEQLTKASSLLQSAVELDPRFAQAWGRLALTLLKIESRRNDPTGARVERAQRAIDTMERLTPDDPQALLQLAAFYSDSHRVDFARAEKYLGRAAQVLPGNGEVARLLGDVDKRHRRFAEVYGRYRRAYELDRQSPEIRSSLILWLVYIRRYDEAEAIARDAPAELAGFLATRLAYFKSGSTREVEAWFAANPDAMKSLRLTWAWDIGAAADYLRLGEELKRELAADSLSNSAEVQMTIARTALGQSAVAREEAEKYVADHKSSGPSRLLAINLALLGEKQAAVKTIDAYLATASERGVDIDTSSTPHGRATVLAWAGEKEKAIAEIARLLNVPTAMNVHWIRHNLYFQPLQGDPRFEALLNDPKNNQPLF
jgi:TolB-like protein